MTVHQYELFHGLVLAKLVRSEHSRTLTLIETRELGKCSVYRVNDVILYMKQAAAPQETQNAMRTAFCGNLHS